MNTRDGTSLHSHEMNVMVEDGKENCKTQKDKVPGPFKLRPCIRLGALLTLQSSVKMGVSIAQSPVPQLR